MQIRDKLTLLFMLIVALILGASSIAIYYSSAQYRREEFYERIENKARNVVKLLIEVEEVDAALLMKIEQDNPISLPNEEITIYDYQDQVLFASGANRGWEISPQLLGSIRLQESLRFRVGQQELVGFLFADNYDRVVVVAGATDVYGFRKLNNLSRVLLIVFGAGMLFTFVSGRIFASRVLKPISRVVSQVDNIGINNLGERLDEGNKADEIARLAGTFNKMLYRLESAFRLQKNFIANASHELRTPLTAITGQLEVTLLTPRTALEYEQTLQSVLDDIRNLNFLSNRLLLLAQANSENISTAFEKIRVDELLWQSASDLQKRNSNYRVSIAFDKNLEEDQLTVFGNEQLIKTVLINLMDNGCKYSNPPEVSVDVQSKNNSLIIEMIDKGIGISEEDCKLIFQPFHRGSNVQNIKGHGIGLSLVERIVSLHKGEILLRSEPGVGSKFTLHLPLNS